MSMLPTVSHLSAIYTSTDKEEGRWQELKDRFQDVYGRPPSHIARAPGRVNLIGEHVDYMLMPCLPMATKVDVLMAMARGEAEGEGQGEVWVGNVDGRYEPGQFKASVKKGKMETTPAIQAKLDWCNYVKCGYRGVLGELYKDVQVMPNLPAVHLLCSGTVPKGSGLSSSSALTTASALAFFTLYAKDGGQVDKETLTRVAVESERLVGVSSGGMDQTASVYSQKGGAILVQFRPRTSAEPVPLPGAGQGQDALECVIANSLETSNKHESAGTGYNLRVVECQVACAIIAKALQVARAKTLKEILDTWQEGGADDRRKLDGLQGRLEGMFEGHLDGYRMDEMVRATGLPEAEFEKEYLTDFPVEAHTFHPFRRIRHAVTESLRVYAFLDICRSPPEQGRSAGRELGRILLASHESLRGDYDCSTDRLDRLVRMTVDAGGYGARITGAGWGGCIVSLVPKSAREGFIDRLKREYYDPLVQSGEASQQDVEDAIVISEPECGACVWVEAKAGVGAGAGAEGRRAS